MILSGAVQQLRLMSPINKPRAWAPPPRARLHAHTRTHAASHQRG